MINFYKFYNRVGLDNHHKYDELIQHAMTRYFEGYDMTPIEHIIMRSPRQAFHYAFDVKKGRWLEAEPYIMKSLQYTYEYMWCVIGVDSNSDILETFKDIIKKEPWYAYEYSIDVIEGRWIEAEPYIIKDPEIAYLYACNIMGERWLEAEPNIKTGGWWEIYSRGLIND